MNKYKLWWVVINIVWLLIIHRFEYFSGIKRVNFTIILTIQTESNLIKIVELYNIPN